MLSLEADVGEVDPLEGARVDGVLVGASPDRRVLAEPAAEADGALVPSKPSATSRVRRPVDGRDRDVVALADDEPLPNIAAYDVVGRVDVIVVLLVIKDERFVIFWCHLILQVYELAGIWGLESTS